MVFLWTILMILIWIAIAFWPARVAGRKGHSFIGYFIFSLFFSRRLSSSPLSFRTGSWLWASTGDLEAAAGSGTTAGDVPDEARLSSWLPRLSERNATVSAVL